MLNEHEGNQFRAVVQRPEAVGTAPEVTGEVTGEVRRLLLICQDSMSRKSLQEALSLKGEENFRTLYLVPALNVGLIEMTIPDKPNSRLQKYRLTPAGKAYLEKQKSGRQSP